MKRERPDSLSQSQLLLLLHSVPHLGEKALHRLLRLLAQGRLTSEQCLTLSAAEWAERYELHREAAEALEGDREGLLARSAELARIVRACGLHLLSIESASYPARLERNDDAPPPLLYGLGNLKLLEHTYSGERFTFTIAVSNGAAGDSLARMESLAAELAGAGGIPVTGHDRTPYKRLALAAQRLNRSVLYVLDRGLREALGPELDRPPFAAARIRDAVFDRDRDLALSPFRLDDHSIGANNRRRDRLVFSLSDVIIACDVRAGGSMADECRRALGQNRPVFVCDGGRDGNSELREHGCPLLPSNKLWVEQIKKRSNEF